MEFESIPPPLPPSLSLSLFVYLSQVRSNAALALGTPQSYGEGVEGCVGVWEAVLGGLERSEHQEEFSEYKHATTLKSQVGHMTIT